MPFQQPPPTLGNQYEDDRVLRSYLARVFPAESLREIEPALFEMGRLSGAELYQLQLADRLNEPKLTQWDAWGNRLDKIEVPRVCSGVLGPQATNRTLSGSEAKRWTASKSSAAYSRRTRRSVTSSIEQELQISGPNAGKNSGDHCRGAGGLFVERMTTSDPIHGGVPPCAP